MFEILLLVLTYLFVVPTRAHAYLDPGTGSFITQLIIGSLIGGTYMIKVFWQQIKDAVQSVFSKKSSHESKDN